MQTYIQKGKIYIYKDNDKNNGENLPGKEIGKNKYGLLNL